MEIRKLRKHEIAKLSDFNKRIYPEKKIDSSHYLNFWYAKSKLEYERTIVVVDEGQNIVGQNIFSTMSYYFQGEKRDSVWGFDLIVDEAYRKMNWGVDLLLTCKKEEPQSFATGSGEDALKMNLKLGQKQLGWLNKNVGLVNPFWIPFALNRQIETVKFPNNINSKKYHFRKVSKGQFPKLNAPYNANHLEIARDIKFLNWRYNNSLHDYAFYMDELSNSWFVVRTTIIKHITVLLLVDWRCNLEAQYEFYNIIQASETIANKIRVPAIITGSSLCAFDKVLKAHHFVTVGRPRPIIGRINIKGFADAIENRNFIFVTLADSDGETNWI